MSATDTGTARRLGLWGWRGWLARLGRARDGTAMVEFAMLIPVLLGFSFGIIDLSLFLFDYHRTGEAVRQGTRTATIVPTIVDVDDLNVGDVVTCTSSGGAVACGAYATPNADSFANIFARIQFLQPAVKENNVTVTYTLSDIGDPTTPGGALPLVTVSLVNVTHELTMLSALPLMPTSIDMPTFSVTFLGNGKAIATASP